MVKLSVTVGIFIHHREYRGHRVFMKDISCLYAFVLSKQFALKRLWPFLLCALCVLCGEIYAQDFKPVHPGVEYAQVDHKIGTDPVKINLLRLDLTKVRLDVHHAMDAAIGTEKTSSIATRHGAVAAINSGFFRLDTSIFAGDAAGVLMVDNYLLSESVNNRIAMFISNDADKSDVSFAFMDIKHRFTFKKINFDFSGVNRERKIDEIIEYSPTFHRSTLTDNNGIEIVVRKGRVTEIYDGIGSTVVPHDGYVISASGKMRNEIRLIAKIGMKVKQATITSHDIFNNGETPRTIRAFADAEDIVAGVPQLIKNSMIDITWEQEKSSKAFVETRHPRTAVAKMKDGKFLMVTVDGRQPGVSVGMNLNELAEYLLSLGAVDAMNLDGGGSTTMFLDGKVVNTPSDKEGERKVGDAILVTLRKIQKPARQ